MKRKMAHGEDGVKKFTQLMLKNEFKSVLDIGAGQAETHANYMRNKGLLVDTVDFFENNIYKENYNNIDFPIQYEGIHAAHVLEHQLNTHNFLRKIHLDLLENGWLCITVPPLKHKIVGGHVSLWNAGLILYHLVLAKFNCKEAKIKTYGYNITVIVKKKTIEEKPILTYDGADMNFIKKYIPPFPFSGATPKTSGSFNGNIEEYNW